MNKVSKPTRETAIKDPSLAALAIDRQMFLGFLVKRLGNLSEAEDVFQEFCLRVMNRKEQLREAEKMNAWLYAVLRSTLNDHYRKNGRERRLSAAFEREQKSVESAETGVEEFSHICKCVRGLVPAMRADQGELIRRIDLEDESHSSIAKDLGITPGALAVRLHRARAALRDQLLDHCGYCCTHGFEDCSCAPEGCEGEDSQAHC